MAMTINTNVVSINSQRNLGLSGGSLATSMQRLSSGLRVNSAKDDAAGLAIAERMNAQSRGLAVAARNANDGISLAQTAEGALGKMGDMLQRMRELAVQSSNATNSKEDREALQAEVKQLTSEIDRVAKTTTFNNQKILDGSFAGGVFQVGAGAGDNITVGGITNAKASALSNVTYGTSTTAIDKTDFEFNIGTGAGAIAVKGYEVALEAGDLQIKVEGMADPIELDAIGAASSYTERLGQVVAAINAKTADSGVTAFLSEKDGAYSIQLMSENQKDGQALDVSLVGFAKEITGLGDDLATVTGQALTAITSVNDDADATSLNALIKAPAADSLVIDSADTDQNVTQRGVDTLSVATQADAWKALKSIDSAIDQVNSARADLGALQTRFEKSIENIDIQNENISAARGRIVDADFATETANLSRSQILQQAGTAMVAQANQLPQQVLSLLQ